MLMSEKASHENHLYNLVCMAACNGEKYIDAQIKSILNQLNEDDRLFISIDPSKDQTKEIVDTFKNRIQEFLHSMVQDRESRRILNSCLVKHRCI